MFRPGGPFAEWANLNLCALSVAVKSSAELADIREHAAKTAYKNNETDTVAEQSCDEQVLEWLGAPTDTLTDQ